MFKKKDEEKTEKEEAARIEEEVHMEMEAQMKKTAAIEKATRAREKKMDMDVNRSARTPFPITFLIVVVVLLCGLVLGHTATNLLSKGTGLGILPPERLDQLEQRVDKLEEHGEKIKTGSVAPSGVTDSGYAPLTGVQETQSVLSKKLHDIEAKLQASSEATASVQTKAETGLATVLAFMQMQRVALAGRSFEKERQVLLEIVGEDETLNDVLDKLEAFSLNGVASTAVLQKEWRALAGKTQAALRQASAHSWQERLIVALENLISIRSLAPEDGMSLAVSGIDLDLAQEKVASALRKASGLPFEVQPIIDAWKIKAMAHNKTEYLLNKLAHFLIASDRPAQTDGGTEEIEETEENEVLQEPAL